MLKKRIIPTLLYDSSLQVVKPVSFGRPYRSLGTLMQYVNTMERRNIDELMLMDITSPENNHEPLFDKIKEFTSKLFCPVTVGGGIRKLDHITKLIQECGADKVLIHGALFYDQDFVYRAARKFGSQAVVANLAVDYSSIITTRAWVKKLIEDGAGEIMITDMDKDGTMKGYNIGLTSNCVSWSTVPIIANGGCASPEDMEKAFNVGADAVAAGSLFLYTEHTPASCAKYLYEKNVAVRVHNEA